MLPSRHKPTNVMPPWVPRPSLHMTSFRGRRGWSRHGWPTLPLMRVGFPPVGPVLQISSPYPDRAADFPSLRHNRPSAGRAPSESIPEMAKFGCGRRGAGEQRYRKKKETETVRRMAVVKGGERESHTLAQPPPLSRMQLALLNGGVATNNNSERKKAHTCRAHALTPTLASYPPTVNRGWRKHRRKQRWKLRWKDPHSSQQHRDRHPNPTPQPTLRPPQSRQLKGKDEKNRNNNRHTHNPTHTHTLYTSQSDWGNVQGRRQRAAPRYRPSGRPSTPDTTTHVEPLHHSGGSPPLPLCSPAAKKKYTWTGGRTTVERAAVTAGRSRTAFPAAPGGANVWAG